ncbi:ATP-grasp domain-containing protein [Candidatus Kaiserbacteria bacterium]|nr:ATP-grasp domain-containing protein [Candidatus Kaiserbacteria bacterium]
MSRIIVGILRGGSSGEYELSLKTGTAMLNALPDERYATRDIFVDKRGVWHLRGMPVDAARALSQVDVVLNALHGGAGEDGTVQRILDRAGVAYAGSRALASGVSLNKARAREILQRSGIRMPHGVVFSLNNDLDTGEMARAVFSQFGPPYVVKPVSGGASIGVRMAMAINDLSNAIADVLDAYGAVLVEQYIRGVEASVGIIEGFRGEELYALPPAHVEIPEGHRHLSYEHHEQGSFRHFVPSSFGHSEKQALIEAARAAHRALGMSHFSRADLILTPRAVYLLEVNSVPGLYPGSTLPPMFEAVGSSTREFLEHAIALTRQ